ncbi:hypothetical protein ACIBBB_11000 [Streptomyces sp. NPDC051217]|uniref:hypothetical protein n=1 Tax=Streptomyces sp. NPDC051217 TaxID=3365644 RepID=UPI00379109E3
MRSMRLRPALVTGILGAIGAVGVTVGTIVPTVLPATTANATASVDASLSAMGDESGDGPGADRQPSCGKASDPNFPIDTRIHGGPDTYRPGGPPGVWSLDLTNSTDEACHNIHPVIVLSDRHRSLTETQVRLQLTDDKDRWRTMSLERSDEDETIAVLEGGFSGFAVPAQETVTVRARLAFTAAADANRIVVNAATVQRRGGDGDWVGESNDYRFSVGAANADAEADTDTEADTDSNTDADPGSATRGTTPGTGTATPARTPHATPDATRAPTANSPSHSEKPSLPLGIGSLADTGSDSLLGPAIGAGLLLLTGGALVLGLRHARNRS